MRAKGKQEEQEEEGEDEEEEEESVGILAHSHRDLSARPRVKTTPSAFALGAHARGVHG